ncbi:hypothetical protein DPMN_011180 [Dreissena polymorpha]|uniref:Uncharacterized protein n=1 Tax=Dreissena polymorpha TaxID=45954 RepID=A0A9D4N4J2_DREPO|nr:hypothetical protein DPMN_011180 [Dreissena polymorpha]
MSTESAGDDDNFGTESCQQLIMKVLGIDRRNRVLSGLYMGRCDSALLVRQAALHVWKVVVPNTARTLREILSTLFSQLLGCLASTSHDKRQVKNGHIVPYCLCNFKDNVCNNVVVFFIIMTYSNVLFKCDSLT